LLVKFIISGMNLNAWAEMYTLLDYSKTVLLKQSPNSGTILTQATESLLLMLTQSTMYKAMLLSVSMILKQSLMAETNQL
jgi:hypothetical protein